MALPERVFITGGASGIGRELAHRLLAQGAQVAVFDIQGAQVARQALCEALALPADRVQAFEMDVRDAASVRRAFDAAAQLGLPDRVIHCAGIISATAFADLPEDEFVRVITVNLIGTRHVAAAALPHLRPGSQLVLTASMAGLIGCYGYAAYGAAKHGVVGLADVLRLEWAPRGIDVSVVCPPEVDTPMVTLERRVRPKATETMKLLAGALTVDEAARQILRGIRARRFLIIPGQRARLMWWVQRLTPRPLTNWFTAQLVRHVTR